MPNFTTQETVLISEQQKLTANLPSYYSSDVAKNVPQGSKDELAKQKISRDFEAYLILQTTEQKQKTLTWIKSVTGITQDNKDRDNILERYLTLRDDDTKAVIAEIDDKLKQFEEFRNGLFASGEDGTKFAEVIEVSLMARSLQRPLDEMYITRESTFHEQNVVALLKIRFEDRKNTTDTQLELESWQTVVSAYRGQEGSSGSKEGSIIGGGLI